MKKKYFMLSFFSVALLMIGGCNAVTNKENTQIVKGETLAITNEELSKHLVDMSSKHDLEELVVYKLLKEKYPVTSVEIDEAYEKEKGRFQDYEMILREENISETAAKFEIEKNLMIEKGVKSEADVSEDTLKKYYENWGGTRTVELFIFSEEKQATAAQQELKAGKELESWAEKNNIHMKQREVVYSNETKMDELLREKADQMKQPGDVSDVFQLGEEYFVIKLIDATEKTTFEKDKAKMKLDYLDEQVTTFNKDKLIQSLVQKEKLSVNKEKYKPLFEDFQSEEPK